MPESSSKAARFLIVAAAFVIVVGGCKLAASLITPVLLAAFLAIIFAPLLLKLRAWRIPLLIALPLLAVPVVIGLLLFGMLLQSSFSSLQENVGLYEQRLAERKHELVDLLHRVGLDVSNDVSFGEFDPRQTRQWATQAVAIFSGLVTNAFLVFILLLIMLLEATILADKYATLDEASKPSIERARRILTNVRQYLVLKTWISLFTGVAVYLMLLVIGVDFPLLWGTLAFLLNYIPNFGSVLAAIPPVVLSLIMDGGGTAIGVAIGYIVINAVVGNVIEPMWMGKGVGLSPLVVLLSLLFWGWVLGPIGTVLSVPLTMTLKIVLESDPSTERIANLLGAIKA